MFSFHPKPERRTSFEDIFFEHYERLMEWALQLTRQDRFEAEDLVQELSVRFARLGTIPERIEDAEGYLFAVLRNLHYTRVKRTRGADGLSIVDYDSVEHGLRAIDRSELLSVRSDLNGICNYLCSRKETSRSASCGSQPDQKLSSADQSQGLLLLDRAVRDRAKDLRIEASVTSQLLRIHVVALTVAVRDRSQLAHVRHGYAVCGLKAANVLNLVPRLRELTVIALVQIFLRLQVCK